MLLVLPYATPEEIAGALKSTPGSKASAKSKPKAHLQKGDDPNPPEPQQQKKLRSPVKPGETSPNPVPPKRVKGKRPDEDKDNVIAALREALVFANTSSFK